MHLKIRIIITLLLICSFGISESGYNTVYLMEFENIKNDFTNSHLEQALPDLINENYKFREDINIEYAGKIKPYIKGYSSFEQDSIKALIINGSFQTIDDKFFIYYEVYDFHNWERLVKRELYCPNDDIICVHDAFLISIESTISPFLLDNIDLKSTIKFLNNNIKSYEINDENELSLTGIKRDISPFSLSKNLENKKNTQGKYGNRYYREFDIKSILPKELPKEKNTSNQLEKLLKDILNDPYEVLIGDLYFQLDPYNSKNVIVEIPIIFSIKNILSHKSLVNKNYQKSVLENGDIKIQFSNKDYTFDKILLDKISLMELQILPVIFFNNRIGQTQLIILDSWNDKYKTLQFQNTSILIEKQFSPLYSITSKTDRVQLIFDTTDLHTLYKFSLPYELFGDYTKVTVKFMRESELDELLVNTYRE